MKKPFVLAVCLSLFSLLAQAQDLPKALSPSEIKAGLKSHRRALFIKQHWIRDPYLVLGPDDYYYLTGTTPNPGDTLETSDPYNTGLGNRSIVGSAVQVWRSKDLAQWEYLGAPFTVKDTYRLQKQNAMSSPSKPAEKVLWAPEIHWINGKCVLVNCPEVNSSLAFAEGSEVRGPWSHPMGEAFEMKHDPSLFRDDDGRWYAIWSNIRMARIKEDFSGFDTEPFYIAPAGSRPDPQNPGKTLSRIGHEGATMKKIGGKYVAFGTAWSTDLMRKGSYNLYYCVADKITGPYGPRKFVGRFLGHGTPFQTRDGKWWCTAFYNANVPPISREGIESRDLSQDAFTINQRGTTIVPLEVKVLKNGEVYIRAVDPAYGSVGVDENGEGF